MFTNTLISKLMKLFYRRINHVFSIRSSSRLSLSEIFSKLKTGSYNPQKFSALTFKISSPKCTIIFFSTGNITLMGGNSYYSSLYVLAKLKEKLNLRYINVKLTNILSTFSVKNIFEFNLHEFYLKNIDKCISNMEIFPACSYKYPNSRIIFKIFNTGSINVAGCKNEENIETSIKYILKEIDDFTKSK